MDILDLVLFCFWEFFVVVVVVVATQVHPGVHPKNFVMTVERDGGCTREERMVVVDVKDFRMDSIKQHYLMRSVLLKPEILENSF